MTTMFFPTAAAQMPPMAAVPTSPYSHGGDPSLTFAVHAQHHLIQMMQQFSLQQQTAYQSAYQSCTSSSSGGSSPGSLSPAPASPVFQPMMVFPQPVVQQHHHQQQHHQQQQQRQQYESPASSSHSSRSNSPPPSPTSSTSSKSSTETIQHQKENHTPHCLFIFHLPLDYDDDRLQKLFEPIGKVAHASVATTAFGTSKGFGFVNFFERESAEKAIQELKGKEVGGKFLHVAWKNQGPGNNRRFPARQHKRAPRHQRQRQNRHPHHRPNQRQQQQHHQQQAVMQAQYLGYMHAMQQQQQQQFPMMFAQPQQQQQQMPPANRV